jgi:phage repressor protein C with HTH and peptisase S24 domain
METIFTNIKERVLQITDLKGISKEKFFNELGVTYGNFKGKAKEKALSSDVLAKIVSINPDINPEWLLTGKGDMLKEDNYRTIYWRDDETGKNVADKLNKKRNLLEQFPHDNKEPNEDKGYPLINATAIGGTGNAVFGFTDRDVKAYYKIPKFSHKKVDFMIEVEGSSMYPKYNSGDVVACTIIKDSAFIQWNKTHVIATREQGIIIKRIKKGLEDDFLTMVSDNNSYDPFEVPKTEITGIALVVGVIRLE